MTDHPPILVVVGPTSSGKSEFGENLALEQGGEILNADSQQFFREFDIGTGKIPSALRRVPHHLLDLCAPGEFITAGEFAQHADRLIEEFRASGRLPVVVGGTGLYIRSLLEGLDLLPARDPALRLQLNEQFAVQGGEALHRRLTEVDPASAAKIHPQDPVRLIRYLEIFHLTGRPPSQLMQACRRSRLRYAAHTYWLCPPREHLRQKIDLRVRRMFEQGWVSEVEGLLAQGIDPRDLQNKPIGYNEIANFISKGGALKKTIETIILRTQQYAKRQETFFRGLLSLRAYRENGSKVVSITGLFP